MIFKKNRKNDNDFFYGKRIAVLGLGPRCGVTHIAVAISNFLSETGHKRVCLAEYSRHEDLKELNIMLGSKVPEKEYSFHRVTYVPAYTDRGFMPEISYDCMVFDFGSGFERSMNIVNLCDIKVAVGTDAPWRKSEYRVLQQLTAGSNRGRSDWKLFVNLGNPKNLKEKESYGIDMGCFPYEPDPLFPCRETINFLEEIMR